MPQTSPMNWAIISLMVINLTMMTMAKSTKSTKETTVEKKSGHKTQKKWTW